MSLQDVFEYGRAPIKPLAYENKDLAQRGEFMVDHAGDHPSYHLYIVDPEDETKIIDITAYMVKEAFGNSITVHIDGMEEPMTLHDLMNFIYKRFTYPDDPNGFRLERDRSKVLDPTTQVVLLQDVDDIHYLPVTRVDAIFDEYGNTLKDLLESLTHLGFSTDYIQVAEEGQFIFEITYPFLNYSQYGNFFELRCGTVILDKTRYQVIDTVDEDGNVYGATITFFNEKFELNRRIDILYIYNAQGALPGFKALDGGQIAYHTISSSKLEKVTSLYTVPDETAIFTAKGAYDLYHDFIRAINDSSDACVYVLDHAEEANKIDVNIVPDTVFLSMKFIVVNALMNTTKTSDITLTVTYGDSNNQYNKVYTINVPGGIPKGRMLKLLVNYSEARVLQITEYHTSVNRYIYTCQDQEITIPYRDLSYNINSFVKVYRNGVRLFEDLDYTNNKEEEVILLTVRTEEGERIVFEAENVEF